MLETTHIPRPGSTTSSRRRRWTSAVVSMAVATGLLTTAGATAHANPTFTVVGADGGVYFRSAADWNTPEVTPGVGIYNGDTVVLECYNFGTTTPYSANHLWYQVVDLSRPVIDGYGNHPGGYVNDHFLNTPGTAANPQVQGVFHC